jgi:1-acyl-sn-glycerol-3-phosphate acyltransferase
LTPPDSSAAGFEAAAPSASAALPRPDTGAARWPLALWRLVRVLLHGLHGLAVTLFVLPMLDTAGRHRRIAWWAGKLLRVMGLRLALQGRFRPGAKLLVANHISWLDIMAVHAVCPEARFVSKAEVRQWPLARRLVDAAGTLYIERARRRDAMRVVHQMAEAMAAGDTVAVFPEGTTGDGHALLPFHANLLQAAIATATPIQPLALRYADARHPISPNARWVGDTGLAQSVWQLLCGREMVVHIQVLPAQASAHADRRALAERFQAEIGAALQGCAEGSR